MGKEEKSNCSVGLADTLTGPTAQQPGSPSLYVKAERVELILQMVIFL